MPFARQVSIGRVALIQFPEAEAGKLVVISDVVSPTAVRWERRQGSRGAALWEGRPPRVMQRARGTAAHANGTPSMLDSDFSSRSVARSVVRQQRRLPPAAVLK